MKKLFVTLTIALFCSIGFAQESFNYTQVVDKSFIEYKKKENHFISQEINLPLAINQPFIATTPSLTFENQEAGEAIFSYRTKEGKKWTDWQAISHDHHSESKDKIVGEQLYLSATTTTVQFKIASENQMENTSFNCRFYFPEKTISVAENQIKSAKGIDEIDCNCPIPAYEARLDWCPSGNCPQDATPTATTVTHLVVHHSAGSNSAPGGDWAAVVRSIWDYHTSNNGWDDVGYNYLIDPNGVIYEGRGNNVQGAHFSCMNGGTMGVCLLGHFSQVEPTTEMLHALTELMAWKACDIDQDPTESSYFALGDATILNLVGHRDGNNLSGSCTVTECPGNNVYDVLPNLRNNIVNYVDDCTLDANSNLVILALESNPTSPIENTQATLSATIKNGGDATTSSSFDIHITIDGDTIYTDANNTLAVQASTDVQTSYTFPAAGNYQLCVYADAPTNELNSLNNSYCKTITVQVAPVGIEELAKIGVAIFPNPVQDILHIEAEKGITKIVLKNMLGQTLIENTPLTTQYQLDISAYAKGIYILEVYIEDKFATQKVVIE